MNELRVCFCDFGDMYSIQTHFVNMISKRFDVTFDDKNPQYVFYSVFGGEHFKYKNCVKIFYTGENIVPNFNFCDYAIGFEYMDFGDRYLRYPLYLFYEKDYYRALNKHRGITSEILDQKKRFCSFVVSNGRGDPIRKEAFEKLSTYKKVDSGGRFLNNMGGCIEDKFAFQQECKFALCFENSSTPGYTTEKLIQAAGARAVPIYWGDEQVSKRGGVNSKAFIHIDQFESLDDVLSEVERLDKDNEAYLTMLREPLFLDFQHKEKFDIQLEGFLNHIFSLPLQKAYRRSRNSLSIFEERRYGFYVRSINYMKKIIPKFLLHFLKKL
ncbi:MAG: glycosyltransferase family 10 [Helicobacter sp.]|uniref:glycosyltransferase family 10 domain-containing protein n=1 Tax=Helicobacter sp. TaxID=218 RepID=UPI003751B487|nr:glycosyltransferase family 10 [Helicobacter sp.]